MSEVLPLVILLRVVVPSLSVVIVIIIVMPV